MAVAIRLTSRGTPARAAAAAFTLASTPIRATGGLSHRVKAVYGTQAVATPGPSTTMDVPPGPTSGNSKAVPDMYPTFSIVKSSRPRVLPGAGGIAHGVPGQSYTIAEKIPALVTPNAVKVRTGAGRGRVTTAPKPTFNWVRQGG